MYRLLIPLLVLAAAAASSIAQETPAAPEPVVDWITAHAIPIATVEPGSGFADLAPLEEILRDVRIVALGEATHGTREFFLFKHRMLEFLVRRMGFTVFAIEASYPACRKIDDYVTRGEGDRAEALAGQGFWTWDTEEVTGLIEWMRTYNESAPPDREVRFVGFDLQVLASARDDILAYLGRVDPAGVASAKEILDEILVPPEEIRELAQRSDEEKEALKVASYRLLGYLSFHEVPFVRKSSREEYETVLRLARVLHQSVDAMSRPTFDAREPTRSGAALRDFYMAWNLEDLLAREKPGTRVVVWAHNGHVSKSTYGGIVPAMGSYLRDVFGDAYYAVGFCFDRGSFQAMDMNPGESTRRLRNFSLGSAPEGLVERLFVRAGKGDCFLDLRSAPVEGEVATWLAAPHGMRSIGAGFGENWMPPQYVAPTVLRDAFDGIVFIEETARARPNPSGLRPRPDEEAAGESKPDGTGD